MNITDTFLLFSEVLGAFFILLCTLIIFIIVLMWSIVLLKPYFKTLFYMIEYLFHRKDFIEWHKKQVENERE